MSHRRLRQGGRCREQRHPKPDLISAPPGEFRRRILPNLKTVPIEKMARGTGLSVRYCSLIRRGLYVPHPRHRSTFLAGPREDVR